MKRKDIFTYLKRDQQIFDQEEEKKRDDLSIKDLSEIEIKNPVILEEVKSNRKSKKSNRNANKKSIGVSGPLLGGGFGLEEELDEVLDGDEGIINRRLPLNSYNHQIQVENHQKAGSGKGLKKTHTANFGAVQVKSGKQNEEEEGWENCREEDEERKDGEYIEQSISRQVLKDKDNLIMDLEI